MAYRNKTESKMSLVDAVEALSTIVDLEWTGNNSNAFDYEVLSDRLKRWSDKLSVKLRDGQNEDIEMVKNIFATILHHLKNLYVDESLYFADEQKNTRVKTIMLLVGEAAAKLDRLTGLFHDTQLKSVHELKEFKQLQEFYLNRVARKIDAGLLGKWILGLQQEKVAESDTVLAGSPVKTTHTSHVFIDLEGVKRDSEYELFFIRKEDGTRFFDPKLIRSIKLVCDFDSYFQNGVLDDPFADIPLMVDRNFNIMAKNLIDLVKHPINRFYHELSTYKHNVIARSLHKAIMALMLASNPKNLVTANRVKSSFEYFVDFQLFLREALQSREYQRMIAYPDLVGSKKHLLQMVNALSHAFYLAKAEMYAEVAFIENIIHEASHSGKGESREVSLNPGMLFAKLNSDYAAMGKIIKTHPNGHLKKILEMVEDGGCQYFDPLMQHNIPMQMYDLHVGSMKMKNIRVPAPVTQENIRKVFVNDEFKAFLRSLNATDNPKFLMFNFQDKTSWREHARAKVLEDLHKCKEFSENFTVVTIPKDTEFYEQTSPYNKESHADVFMKNLKEQLMDESAGFYLPEDCDDLEWFIDKASQAIHNIFFQSKNVLTRDQRLDFIEIFYFFLELKILDIYKPNYFSFTCKDAVDISGGSNGFIFACLKLINQERLSEKDKEFMDFLIYGIPITVRERLMLKERFNRMVSAIKVFETAKSYNSNGFSKLIKDNFAPLYDNPVLEAKFNLNS